MKTSVHGNRVIVRCADDFEALCSMPGAISGSFTPRGNNSPYIVPADESSAPPIGEVWFASPRAAALAREAL